MSKIVNGAKNAGGAAYTAAKPFAQDYYNKKYAPPGAKESTQPTAKSNSEADDKSSEAEIQTLRGITSNNYTSKYSRQAAVTIAGCRFNRYKNIQYGAVGGGVRSLFFMVMPQLYLFSEDTGEPKIANWITLGETSFMQKYKAPNIAAQLDLYGGDRLRQQLGGAYNDSANSEIGLFLSGQATECALPDMEVNLLDTTNNLRGKNTKIAGGGEFIAFDTSVSITFRNDFNGYTKSLMRIWLKYIMGCKSGKVQPRLDDIIMNRVCYSTSAFIVNLEPDGETITDISEILMMYPTTFPSSQAGHTKSLKHDEEFTVNFYAGAVKPMEDSLFDKFNFRLNTGAIESYKTHEEFHAVRQGGNILGHVIDDPYHKYENKSVNLDFDAFNYPLGAKVVYMQDTGKYKLVYTAEGVNMVDTF